MIVRGYKSWGYEYRKGLRVYYSLYYCPFCDREYREWKTCEHFLFELKGKPYFTNDDKVIEKFEREYEKFIKAWDELNNLARSGEISAEEFLRRWDEIKEEYDKALSEIVKDAKTVDEFLEEFSG